MDDFCYSVIVAGATTGAGAGSTSMDFVLCNGDGDGLVLRLPNREGSGEVDEGCLDDCRLKCL